MGHIYDHIISMGYLRRGCTEENEQDHKNFKQLYNNASKHIDCIAPNLLARWVYPCNLSYYESESDSDDDIPT